MDFVCIECNSKKFKESDTLHSAEIRGEIIKVITSSFVCQNCRATVMNSEQMNRFRRISADQYRLNHKLLTSYDIVNCRKQLGMSQIEFARYLKVGSASIKRWETYFVQDESQNELIRLKCN
tara:strand:+ start:214 stop:579 length:366 start_codon:yes stop_codon:yes gene_type:complete